MGTFVVKHSFWIFSGFIIVLILISVAASFAHFFVAKDYFFHVEAPCDETSENCFVRSCVDYCPPNVLESYKVYEMPAALYSQCSDNSCKNVCEVSGQCTEISCSPENEDSCTVRSET